MNLLGHALQLADAGLHVFPLLPRSKRPATKEWRTRATTDGDVVRAWWQRHPDHNIGINLETSGLLAIDLDPRNGGTQEQLIALCGGEPPAPFATQRSGRGDGGGHLIYRVPPLTGLRVAGRIGPGIDVKWRGYIVGAGSVHPETGGVYTIDLGSGLHSGILPADSPLGRLVFIPVSSSRDVNSGEPLDDARWREVLDALEHIPADSRAVWVNCACALKSTGRDEAFEVFDAWAARSEKYQGVDDSERLWATIR